MAVYFITLAALGVLAAAGLLLPRLLGRQTDAAAAAEVATADNIAAGRERMRILRTRAAAGEISVDEYEEYTREIEEQLARDLEQARALSEGEAEPAEAGRRDWRGAAIVLVALVAVPAVMYPIVGSPQLLAAPQAPAAAAGQPPPGMAEIENRLRTMIAENPEEAESHYWLGKVLASQGRAAAAAESFSRARMIAGNSPDLLASEAAALMDADPEGNAKDIDWLIASGLEMDAQDSSLLWLAGLNADRKGDTEAALSYWERAQASITDEESGRQIAAVIADARQRLGLSDDDEAAAPAPPIAATHSGVQVQVDLADPADGQQQAVLFVFARTDAPGPPLAVYRREVAGYPLTVVLDDRLAMMPSRKMSDFSSYTIVARLSRSGQPTASSGDRYGEVQDVAPGQSVTVVIDSTVP